MGGNVHTSILFIAACSLTKREGGRSCYEEEAAMASHVGFELGSRLLKRREEVRGLIKNNQDLAWQGVRLANLEFNRDLTKGLDFGGHRSSSYLPAIDRYRGRFWQALGEGGRQALCGPGHNMLIVSGLYGLLHPMEGTQLYSCPLSAEVAETWDRDSLLTDILSAYIERHGILMVFDLLAINAYRQLIDWQTIRDTGVEVLHCFDTMASGESALTSLGMFLASDLITRTEDALVDICDGDRIGNVIFRSSVVTPFGFPDELAALMAARNESRIWQPQYPDGNVREIIRGGNPTRSPGTARGESGAWTFTLAKEVRRDLRNRPMLLDKTIRAIMEVCEDPMSVRGNTVKPLANELRGMWRYRIDNFRLVYEPDAIDRVVHFLGLKPRAEAYQ